MICAHRIFSSKRKRKLFCWLLLLTEQAAGRERSGAAEFPPHPPSAAPSLRRRKIFATTGKNPQSLLSLVCEQRKNNLITLYYQTLDTMATISQNIKRIRTKQGLTQDDLAKKADIKYSTLTKIEGGVVTKPSVQTIQKIAKSLGVSIEELLK